MNEPIITVVGNVAGEPRQRTTPTGVTVVDFRIAATPRRQDKAAGTWGDGETLWFGVTAWRTLGEHCAQSLKKGDRVMVSGRLTTRSWEAENGERRAGLEIDANHVGLELTRATASSQRTPHLVGDWASSGLVDPVTGEVRGVEPEELEEVGPVPAAA